MMYKKVTEKLPELKTNILDLMFLDSVDVHFGKWSRTESDQGKRGLLAHLSIVCIHAGERAI